MGRSHNISALHVFACSLSDSHYGNRSRPPRQDENGPRSRLFTSPSQSPFLVRWPVESEQLRFGFVAIGDLDGKEFRGFEHGDMELRTW